jgi:hypothetical protein
MSCLSSTVRAEKQAQLVKLEAQLLKAETAYGATLEGSILRKVPSRQNFLTLPNYKIKSHFWKAELIA